MQKGGVVALPITVVDREIAKQASYPLIELLRDITGLRVENIKKYNNKKKHLILLQHRK